MLVFTDGEDLHGSRKTDVNNSVNETRNQNPQFMIFTMGYGNDYNESFFNNLSRTVGSKHFHLTHGSINQFAEFNSHVRTFTAYRIVFDFFTEAKKQLTMQVAAGEVEVANDTVPVSATVNFATGATTCYFRGAQGTLNIQGGNTTAQQR